MLLLMVGLVEKKSYLLLSCFFLLSVLSMYKIFCSHVRSCVCVRSFVRPFVCLFVRSFLCLSTLLTLFCFYYLVDGLGFPVDRAQEW